MAGLLTVSLALPMPRAEAVDFWGAAAQALGVYSAYQSTLSSMLAMGNNVHAQIQSRQQDLKENGRDRNPHDIAIVDEVMNRLVNHADYALKDNSLPFIWSVNDSKVFNAACYPTDYVSINRGLVRGLNCDPDEIAAVLGHELTHGLEQHSAHDYAKAVAQYYGMSFLNMDANLMDWNKLAGLANYSIAKNVTAPNGMKTIYIRITSPTGSVLGSGASFSYENRTLQSTMSKSIEYGGRETPVTAYWNVSEALTEGTYNVSIFADGNMIGSRSFSFK